MQAAAQKRREKDAKRKVKHFKEPRNKREKELMKGGMNRMTSNTDDRIYDTDGGRIPMVFAMLPGSQQIHIHSMHSHGAMFDPDELADVVDPFQVEREQVVERREAHRKR